MIKILVCILALNCLQIQAGSFFVKKNTGEATGIDWSRTQFCEQIGVNIKQVFTESVQVVQQLAKMQIEFADTVKQPLVIASLLRKNGTILHEISELQKLCTRMLEALIDEHQVFKKSDKAQLEAMHTRLLACAQVLAQQHTLIATKPTTGKQKKTAYATAFVTQTLEQCLVAVERQIQALRNDECIKKI